jgi:hypothetical protein
MIQRNPKFYDFKGVAPKRQELIQNQSVFLTDPTTNQYGDGSAPGNIVINKDYQAFIYANIDKDKTRRLLDYRRMAAYAELADCLDEIADECVVKDENDDIATFQCRGEWTKEVKDLLQKEFKKFIVIFNLEDDGWEYFRQFLVDGELYFENIIDKNKTHLGIIGIIQMPAEMVNPVYSNVQNELVKGFLLRKPATEAATSNNRKDQEDLFFMEKAQVTYVHSGTWNEFKTIRLPYIENAKRAYRQLSLIEDSIVIYRLVRAPERLKFTIYTGTMPTPKAEAYVKRMMQSFWSKKNYDTSQGQQGRITNIYDTQSMRDAYWFAQDAQGKGHNVELMPGGQNLGQLDDLNYFLKKLYNSLKIPISRFLVSDASFTDGNEITRDELRFARFVIRIQRQFATSIRETFIAHLKLKGYWDQYKLKERAMNVELNIPTSFMAMREQQLLDIKFDNFLKITGNQSVSTSYAQKYYLGLNDDLMKENREWLKKDAALTWELSQIQSSGPNFREQLAAQGAAQGDGAEIPGMAGGGGGSSGDGPEIPNFGGGSTVPGEEGEPLGEPPSEPPGEPAGGVGGDTTAQMSGPPGSA